MLNIVRINQGREIYRNDKIAYATAAAEEWPLL